ncbi:MAG: response regulator, partial [Myxococcales bacterium]|nr:response regulator [Myxococcales bacterium]
CRSIGKPRTDILGKNLSQLRPESVGPGLESALRRAGEERRAVSFEHFHAAEGRWYEHRAYPSEEGVSSFSIDITERKRSEQGLVASQEGLRRAKDALERADRRKDEFLAILAHELRNPLGSIMAGARLLRRPASPAKAEQTRGMIEREVVQLDRLVEDLLDVSRITAGRVVLRTETIDLRERVERAVETTRPAFESRRHHLRLELPFGPVFVQGDAARLLQVFVNLLNNAAKYTHPGGHVRVALAAGDQQAEVRIADDGIGIAPEELPQIFRLFGRAERTEEHGASGHGIGLTLSKRLVEVHGGSIEVSSRGVNRGSEFVVRLPLVTPPGPPALPAEAPPRQPERRPLRVLLVDDSDSFRETMGALLAAMGHDVRTAPDGAGAVTAARGFRPQLVLLDIGLSGESGYDVARAMREDPLLARTLIIALTGFGGEQDKQKASAAGIDHHLTKPASEQDIEALLEGVEDD